MDWKKLSDQAKEVIDKRGGPESVKEDAKELKDIARGEGTLSEKLKRAAKAIQEPGARGAPSARPAGEGGGQADSGGGSS